MRQEQKQLWTANRTSLDTERLSASPCVSSQKQHTSWWLSLLFKLPKLSLVFLPATSACGKPWESSARVSLLPEGLGAAIHQCQLIKMAEAEKWMACVYLAAPLSGNSWYVSADGHRVLLGDMLTTAKWSFTSHLPPLRVCLSPSGYGLMVEPPWTNTTLFMIHVGLLRNVCIIVSLKITQSFWKWKSQWWSLTVFWFTSWSSLKAQKFNSFWMKLNWIMCPGENLAHCSCYREFSPMCFSLELIWSRSSKKLTYFVFSSNFLALQICSSWAALFTNIGIAVKMID